MDGWMDGWMEKPFAGGIFFRQWYAGSGKALTVVPDN